MVVQLARQRGNRSESLLPSVVVSLNPSSVQVFFRVFERGPVHMRVASARLTFSTCRRVASPVLYTLRLQSFRGLVDVVLRE